MTYTTEERSPVPTPPCPFTALRDVYGESWLARVTARAFQAVHVHSSSHPYEQLCAVLRYADLRSGRAGGYHGGALYGAAFAAWGEPEDWAWDRWVALHDLACDFLGVQS